MPPILTAARPSTRQRYQARFQCDEHRRRVYEAVDRPRGAEVRLHSSDAVAIAAIHEFLAFQRGSHHAAGHEGLSTDSH